ncbi:MAG: hypothetical protein CVV61_06345 [Tenericutes bacterium HGW-Tenericutes-6]|jgi:glycerophosphoryl diester phosphodiesterase|nr:MAG: hypothetical protein CVV61_06345 [Tenericutes bacterium HGW-Tenericutes-6]
MKYIAHRGLSSKAPENTTKAFELAGQEQKYFGIECDIRTTKDHQFVVFHDEDLTRMMRMKGKIADFDLKELKEITIKRGNQVKKYADLHIPTLDEFMDICSYYNKTAVIEIKEVHEMTLLTELISKLDEHIGLSVIVISFNITNLKYLRALSEHIELQLLIDKLDESLIYDARVNHIDISINKDVIKKKGVVSRLKKEGFKIGVYTVNDVKDMMRMQSYKVDYLTTDK